MNIIKNNNSALYYFYTDSNGNPVLDKNGNKKTIPYSKQNKVKAYMNGMDLTEEEYEMIWDILYP